MKQQSLPQRINQFRWIEPPPQAKLGVPFVKAVALRPIGQTKVQYEVKISGNKIKVQVDNSLSYVLSDGKSYDDMCEMDILNQPQVLNNLIERYRKNKICTFIGPTLIIINPYKILPQYFSNEVLLRIREKILSGKTEDEMPHIYLMAGKAYTSMIDQQKKQSIVISGESGAGKTQSTKYCLQLLTSLSHKQKHAIQQKILACNPILQAFGNSKTIRNDNSSRFGKYMRVFFTPNNTIAGATIQSYLLQKSRVVSVADDQRSFHIFYALVAGYGNMMPPEKYNYLEKSKCFNAGNIDDRKYFKEIEECMNSIGFTKGQQNKIWELLKSILELGNIQFDDKDHIENQQKPCIISNISTMERTAQRLSISESSLQQILLYEKRKFLKQVTYSAYNKNLCFANINTLSKAIYNAIFEFILFQINNSLTPKQKMKFTSINILDIFGFENFQKNSFEQFCINYTNQKLLKLYNQYVFQREMILLKEDGLGSQIQNILPPTNDAIIEVISGKLSLFSIINDNTMPKQFTDKHIIQGIEGKLGKSPILKFDKIDQTKFIILHSQCSVKYEINGFKQKNQDKVLEEIANIVNNLFEHENKEQRGKTLLNKFQNEIDDLMSELTSSHVHFIRCIKPNEKKVPNFAQENYILAQVRYLGVFETIQIRKKTFPSRWLFSEFVQRFQMLFPGIIGNQKLKTEKILKTLHNSSKGYLIGNMRVYMDPEVQHKLSVKLHQFMAKRVEAGKKIWKNYKNYRFRKDVKVKLTTLVRRIRLWRKFGYKKTNEINSQIFKMLKEYSIFKKNEERNLKNKKLLQIKNLREEEERKLKNFKATNRTSELRKLLPSFERIIIKMIKFNGFRQMTKNSQKTTSHHKYQPKSIQNYSDLNESLLNQSIVEETSRVYKRTVQKKEQKKEFEFNQSFLNEKSIDFTQHPDVLFQGCMPVPFYDKTKNPQGLKKLKSVLGETYKFKIEKSEEDFFSPTSDDDKFQIEETPQQLMDKIVNFSYKNFLKGVLRKRTNFIGVAKDEQDIMVVKNKPLSKSLTPLTQEDEIPTLKVFKILLKIGEENKLNIVFKYIEEMINIIQNTSPQVKNQILLQLLKQSNTTRQVSSVRIQQTLVVFLHIYNPDHDFLMASLHFFFKKINDKNYTEKQRDFTCYIFKKLIRKVMNSITINYMPIKYQIMALMCKRQITVPVYLAVGNSILARVQSYETFADIKIRVLEEFGIDHQRINPDYFTFFEIMNFENQELQESPILENQILWDTVTYWQRAKERYESQQIVSPAFFLMLKIRYVYQCHYDDEETIELMFHQCYFDYFIGRIRMDIHNMGILAACVKLLKFKENSKDDTTGTYPVWASKAYSEQQLIEKMVENTELILMQGIDDYEIKFKFITICEQCPLSMSLVIQTEQNIKLFLQPKKIYLTEKNQIIEEIPVKKITKFAEDQEKFVFEMRGAAQTKIVYTQHGSICCGYLSLLPKLVTRNL